MSENSFIQIYKELLLHPSFISAPHAYAKVLITIITHACYSACKMDDHGVCIDLLPGEFLCTIRRLVELSGATKKEVENALARFSKAAILGQEKRHTKTIHKILWGVKYKTMETTLETRWRQDGDIKQEEQENKNKNKEQQQEEKAVVVLSDFSKKDMQNKELHIFDSTQAVKQKSYKIKSKQVEKKESAAVVLFYECLKSDTRLDRDDRANLMRFDEDRVILALEYSHEVKASKTLMAQLVWHCQQEKPPQNIIKKDFKKFVKENYKHGEIYNGAECWHSETAIAFQRGQKILTINKSETLYEEKFKKILNEFKISYKLF